MRLIGPRAGSSTLKAIVLVLVSLLCGSGLFAWSKLRVSESGAAPEKDNQAEETVSTVSETLSLGEFLINLRSSDGHLRYLQTEISIVVIVPESNDTANGGDTEEERELPSASHRYARDVAIEVLSNESFEHLRGEPDRSKLKAHLQQKLDAALQSHEVQDVLFTTFVMQ